MTRLYTACEVRALDQALIDLGTPGVVLMKRAGRAMYAEIQKRWPSHKLLVLCGPGNNGGDGYVVAALAKQNKRDVELFYTKHPSALRGEAREAARYAEQEGVPMSRETELLRRGDFDDQNVVIVDALLGTGVQGKLKSDYGELIAWINQQPFPVVAADVPSGLNSDTGYADVAVQADLTVSFIARKRGLYTGVGPEYTGTRCFDTLVGETCIKSAIEGLAKKQLGAAARVKPSVELAGCNIQTLLSKLKRRVGAHKGDSGRVAVIGGNVGMAGAAIMSAESCLYSGAGLVSVYTRTETVLAANARIPEVMASTIDLDANHGLMSAKNDGSLNHIPISDIYERLKNTSAICIGLGIGKCEWAVELCSKIISFATKLERPCIIDADALNLIAKGLVSLELAPLNDAQHILTPHPGEAARLLGTTVSAVQEDRFTAVRMLQQRFGGVVLLKGAGTLICDGEQIFVLPFGNPGMATGGMGDVLAGVISALVAQGLRVSEACHLGAVAHSAAADILVERHGQIGLRATELNQTIRSILNGKTSLPS